MISTIDKGLFIEERQLQIFNKGTVASIGPRNHFYTLVASLVFGVDLGISFLAKNIETLPYLVERTICRKVNWIFLLKTLKLKRKEAGISCKMNKFVKNA